MHKVYVCQLSNNETVRVNAANEEDARKHFEAKNVAPNYKGAHVVAIKEEIHEH